MAAHKYHSVVQKRIKEQKNPACGKANPAANKMRTNDRWRSTAWILQTTQAAHISANTTYSYEREKHSS